MRVDFKWVGKADTEVFLSWEEYAAVPREGDRVQWGDHQYATVMFVMWRDDRSVLVTLR